MIKQFGRLELSNWRQFRHIDIEFHDRLTVLTGANGAGKITLLNLLSRHFGWQGNVVSTPRRIGSITTFSSDYWSDETLEKFNRWLDEESKSEPPQPLPPVVDEHAIGTLKYGEGPDATLKVPTNVSAQFQVNISGQVEKRGMHVPSHRPIFSHQSVENIPTSPRRRDAAYRSYIDIVRNRYYGGHTHRTPNYYMKETLIALAAFGYGNKVIEQDTESLAAFEGFQEVLKTILPPSLGFLSIAIRLPEVVLVTRSGEFSIDAVSGGIASLIDLAWQIFMYAEVGASFAVTLDEPENHLHPELQRTILGSLLQAFPNVQFICATHNPFIVTSVPESNVYALRYGDDHRVRSEALSSVDRSGSSNEVLRDILGLPSSSPMWVERRLAETEDGLQGREVTPQLLEELRAQLTSAGLERFVPTSLARLAEQNLRK